MVLYSHPPLLFEVKLPQLFLFLQLTRSTKEDEDQETTTHLSHPSKTVQVHGAARTLQEAILPSCLPFGAKTEQHGGAIHRRGVLALCGGGSRGKRTEPWSLREPGEEP